MPSLVEIRFLTSKGESLKPDTLPFRIFAELADALSDLTDSALEVAMDRDDQLKKEVEANPTVPFVNFRGIQNKGADFVIGVEDRVAPVIENLMDGMRRRDLANLEPSLVRPALNWKEVAEGHGYEIGIKKNGSEVRVPAAEKLTQPRVVFRYKTTMRGTVVRMGGDPARVRVRLLNGYAYSSLVDREFTKSLTLYTDYRFTGDAEADANTMQITAFKIRDAEPVVEADIDAVLARLAATAKPEFITTDTTEFFANA